MLVYTDDLLVIAHDAEAMMMCIDKYFRLKPESVGEPDIYLGAKIRKLLVDGENHVWAQSSSAYVKEAVRNVEKWTEDQGMKLPSRCDTPMASTYRPELDVTSLLLPEIANWYQSAIGVLRWTVELGRVDIATEVSMLAAYMVAPRVEHLVSVLRIFAYLKKHHNARLVHDPTYPVIDHSSFKEYDWNPSYGNVKEAKPPNAPRPLGQPVTISAFVDADHAGNRVTRRSRTGFLLYINNSPIVWYTKRQGSVEGATYGSELMAMKTAVEENRALRYKLRMMGVPIEGPKYMYGDNMSVIHNKSKPESKLKKKSNSIAYHLVREAVAMGEVLTESGRYLKKAASVSRTSTIVSEKDPMGYL